MNKEMFASRLDEFLDSLKKDKNSFLDNMQKLDNYRDKDMLFIEWMQLYLEWEEVTSDMAKNYFEEWDDEDTHSL